MTPTPNTSTSSNWTAWEQLAAFGVSLIVLFVMILTVAL